MVCNMASLWFYENQNNNESRALGRFQTGSETRIWVEESEEVGNSLGYCCNSAVRLLI